MNKLDVIAIKNGSKARLPIPFFRNLFFGRKKTFLPGFLRISFYSCFFRRNFSQVRGFGEFAGIPLFFIPVSSGFLRISVPTKSCLA
jgi:hypothetical protein